MLNYLLAIFTLVALAFPVAHADVDDEPFYFGIDYGRTAINAESEEDFDEDRSAASVTLGATFLPFLGAELRYTDFGQFGENSNLNADTRGLSAALVLYALNTDDISLYVRGGRMEWETDVSVVGFEQTYDGSDMFYGIGMDINFDSPWSLSIGYSRYDVEIEEDEAPELFQGDLFELDRFSIGFKLKF